MILTTDQIIEESERRTAILNADYNPITGEGSPLERVKIFEEDGRPVWVPVEMKSTEVVRWCLENDKPVQRFFEKQGYTWAPGGGIDEWIKGRCRFDYEYFCAIAVNIETKVDGIQPLVLNRPQRISMAQREGMRLSGVPIKQLELKHRQYGSTTEKNAYLAWYQNQLKRRWNGYVISLQADQARKIVARYKTIADKYPPLLGSITMAPYFGAQNTKVIKERDCWLAIGTAKNPNAPSGDTVQLVLISEAGKMGSSSVQNAEKLITNIMSMVPLAPDTCVLVESTAEESGKWFKREVERSRNKESGFHFTFISWLVDETRVLPVDNPVEFVESWSSYERETLWEEGATLEQIMWYRVKQKDYQEVWSMRQEHPTTPEEAFQVGERRLFKSQYVAALREDCISPIVRGEIVADAVMGPDALKNIEIEEKPMGHVHLWRYPDDDYGGFFDLEKYLFTNRYAVAADVGGKWKGADYSNICVLDRIPMLANEPPEIVFDWYGRGDSDLFAWLAIQVATYYNNAKLYIESNYYDRNPTRQEQNSTEVLTVLHEVRDHYDNLYLRLAAEDGDTREKTNYKIGFHTNKKTKPIIINKLNKRLRQEPPGYVERSYGAADELDTYIVHQNGYWGASDGKFDDRVITRALLMFAHDEMGSVMQVEKKKKRKRKTTSAATF